jgi:hypothetical protein
MTVYRWISLALFLSYIWLWYLRQPSWTRSKITWHLCRKWGFRLRRAWRRRQLRRLHPEWYL